MSANIHSNFRITTFVGGEMESVQHSEVKQSGVILAVCGCRALVCCYDVAGLLMILIFPQYARTITYVGLVQETNIWNGPSI